MAELLEMFEPFPEDPALHYKYVVEPHHVARLQRAVKHPIDLDCFDYLIAAYQKGT